MTANISLSGQKLLQDVAKTSRRMTSLNPGKYEKACTSLRAVNALNYYSVITLRGCDGVEI